jgi:predicted ATPase
MRQGLASQNAIGTKEDFAVFSNMLAEAYAKAGVIEKGLHQLAEALSEGQRSGLQFWEAELHRSSGELLLLLDPPDEDQARQCFQRALDTARSQQAKSLELRAATSLARLLLRQGDKAQGRELLEPVYSWFSEGYDTVDLVVAKTLLGELS